MKTILVLLIGSCLLVGCKNQRNKPNHTPKKFTTVVVQPFGSIDSNQLNKINSVLATIFDSVVTQESISLPAHAYYAARKRYRADSLIQYLANQAGKNEVVLGITDKDISSTKGVHADWGVMGLGFSPGSACIISSSRVKNKTDLYKVALHELGHTAGLPHCKENTCYLRDADGGYPLQEEKGFCNNCKKYLTNKNWHLN
jgi:archaemetzincin